MNFEVSAFVKPVWKYVGIDALKFNPAVFTYSIYTLKLKKKSDRRLKYSLGATL